MRSEEVSEIPDCDFCLTEGRIIKAKFFGSTSDGSPAGGKKANMCQEHYDQHGSWIGTKLLVKTLLFLFLAMIYSGVCSAAPAIVTIAESQIGKGEIGGNNKGIFVKRYTQGQEVAWCAGFVSWVRFHAGQRDNYFLSARSYWNTYRCQRVSSPRTGDIIIFRRGLHSGHVGIVETVQGSTITTIEGNVGAYPARVARFTYRLNHIKNLLGFIRLP